MLVKHGADISVVDVHGHTLLHQASYLGDMDLFNKLVELGADISASGNCRETPLHLASSYRGRGHVEAVKALLELGANVMATTAQQETPLHMASYYENHDNVEIVKLLLKYGSNVLATDWKGSTPLE
ncbi:ankyrin repeat protein, partial [Xylariales sp. PMI_506]